MAPEEWVLVIQVHPARRARIRLLAVHRTPRCCAPWWRAVAAAFRLVVGLEA